MAPWRAWLSPNWLAASGKGGDNSSQGHSKSNTLTANNRRNNNPFITNESDDPVMRERLFRREFCNKAPEAVEDIDANWMEVDSDIDSPTDDNYDPHAYHPSVSKLDMASSMASNAKSNLTATAGSLASAATSIVANAATSAVQTAIQKATDMATANDFAYRGLSTRESVRDPFDELRLRLPGQRLGLWEAEEMEGPENMERSTLSSTGFDTLNMNLSEIVRVEQGMRESQDSVSTNSQRSRWEKRTRRRGLKDAGSELGSNSRVENDAAMGTEQPGRISVQTERNGDERGERDKVASSEDSDDDSFDSVHEVLDNRGEYIVAKVQRRFQRRQQRKKRAMEEKRAKEKRANEERDKERNTSVQQSGPYLHPRTSSTTDEEVNQLQPTPTEPSPAHRSSRQPRGTATQRSHTRRPPSPGSSRIAMISYNADRLPRSSRSDGFFEWN